MKTVNEKKKRNFTMSDAARARLGRKQEFPGVHELARRCEISVSHARAVWHGTRVGAPIVMETLAEIKAREASK